MPLIFLCYNFLLFAVVIFYSPFHIIRLIRGSKYRESTLPRLGFQKIPKFSKDEQVFWFHSVSVGETQVAATLIKELKEKLPTCKVVVSTATETGQAIARRIEGVDASFYYPIDFTFLIKSMIKRLKPSAMIVVETDIWLSFVNYADRMRIPLFLVNGKMSERTLKRYQKKSFIPKLFVSPFDHFFVQSETYANRFRECNISHDKISIVGNVKLDSSVPYIKEADQKRFLEERGLDATSPLVVVGSTHAGEEELIIEVFRELQKKIPDLQCALVPRHPERFQGVAQLLEQENIVFNRTSKIESIEENRPFLLVDEMGQLMKFYQLSTVSIVAGSFTPHVGGHNILEPSFYGKAFICGPWLYKQPGFEQLNNQYNAGIQCSSDELFGNLLRLLKSSDERKKLGENGQRIISTSKGAGERITTEILAEISL